MYKRRLRLGELIKRTLLFGILAVVAVALGAKFLAGYRVRSALDELVSRTAPFGDLRYFDVGTTYDGKVHIEKLSFYPNELIDMDPLITEEVVVLTPGLLYLLGLEGGPVPSRMGISLLGMWVDLASMTGLGGVTGGSLSGNPFEAVACGDVDSFQSPDLEDMGYSPNMRMDVHLRYEIRGDNLNVTLEQSSLEVSGFSLSFDLLAPSLLINPLNQSPEDFKLRHFSLELASSDFNRRRNEFCAGNAEVSVQEFIDNNITRTLSQLQRRGVVPSQEMIQHYQAFMAGEGTWQLKTRPEPPVGFTDIAAFDLEQLLEWLNVRSKIGNQPESVVRFETFELVEEDEDENEDQRITSGSLDPREVVAQTVDPWVAIPMDQARGLLERPVRIETSQGQRYVGFLENVTGSNVVIETRVPGGVATIPIPIDQIAEFETRRSVLDARASAIDPAADEASTGESEPADGEAGASDTEGEDPLPAEDEVPLDDEESDPESSDPDTRP